MADRVGGPIKGTNTINFIRKSKVPRNCMKNVMYEQFVCTEHPEKAESNRTTFMVGRDWINYSGEVATPTSEMLMAKLLISSIISTEGSRFMAMDISNF